MINFIINHTPLFYWTQSLWRDEAFSVWIAQGSLREVIERTSGDFNPPLYYLLLHFWMQLFGRSEIALRSLSVVAFLLFLVVVYFFAKVMFRSAAAGKITFLIAAVNPMLIYFAFELRMYALLTLFVTLSMYFFYTRRWILHSLVTALGLYTQPYMALVLLAQVIYLTLTRRLKLAITIGLGVTLLYLPWIPTLISQFRHSGPMWMYPIDLTLILAVVGNLFMGYEGTPNHLWSTMQLISLLFALAAVWIYKKPEHRKKAIFLFSWILVPLIVVLTISLIKPVYVHRYLIMVTVGLVFLTTFFITTFHNRSLKFWLAATIIGITGMSNFYVVSFHHKIPIRDTFSRIKSQIRSTDLIFAETPLVYFESIYYAPTQIPVLLYNPYQISPPRFVGGVGMPETVWAQTYPVFPGRAFLIKESGVYTIETQKKR